MTFETEEGVNRALKMAATIEESEGKLDDIKYWFDEFEIEIKQASEPSDIIWENRQYTELDRFKKEIICTVIMIIMLIASFIVMFMVTDIKNDAITKYPIIEYCTALLGADDNNFM